MVNKKEQQFLVMCTMELLFFFDAGLYWNQQKVRS
ncbi:hypothetical protein SAMN05192529_11069 [Arachidicoccus rhizosphaerae]|uniref:Uncharacterized protein n=1 Tax=Arachidicoccus rhizosphaerae TaxID=551991 RepID=A0A1H3Z7E4_9BACT|nr:hypothetical protein SAMN05192529_11069 [Arachidicoccus rhizosphaerae]